MQSAGGTFLMFLFPVTVKLFLCEPGQSSISDAVEMGEAPVPPRPQPTLMGHSRCLKL